ncbi:MAG: hypothetical protein LAT64_05375 [Phycisphaerales bacterium]|nr:hypothetical protein [Planctomycetota bacterium]MCH8508186.1 hypothetical protein [Phycisphaerales bacterium]
MTTLITAIIAGLALAHADAPRDDEPLPLNLNLAQTLLPTASEDRLVKLLMIGDSQMGQSGNRLAGQVQKWDLDIVGRLYSCEFQGGAGVYFTSVTGSAYGANLSSLRLGLGDDHGDGNTGSHFHHSRRFSVFGTITPDFSRLGVIGMSQGAPTRTPDFDARKNARVAVYDRPGGFTRFRLGEHRGGASGQATDFGQPGDPGSTLTGSGAVRWYQQTIRPAGELGQPGQLPVGIEIMDSDGDDTDRPLHILGALIHDSPQGTAFPDQGLVVSHISSPGWSAYDHLNTLRVDAIDAMIQMNEGVDLLMVVLGHNREDDFNANTNPEAYPINLKALADLIADRHAAHELPAPEVLFVAPWPLGTPDRNERLAFQTRQLYELCAEHGYGFINLFDFFGRQTLGGSMTTPRGSFTYTMDGPATHPGDAATASLLMQDIEWHFDPANWHNPCPADLTGDGVLNFFDVAAYLALFNAGDPAADLTGDGKLNFFDLAAYLQLFNAGCP